MTAPDLPGRPRAAHRTAAGAPVPAPSSPFSPFCLPSPVPSPRSARPLDAAAA
jgi:hypothetical protein